MSAPAASAGTDEEPGHGPGVRELLTTALDAFRTRLDLAAVELEIHLLALARMLVWAVAAIVCGLLAVAFSVTALIAALWDTHRSMGLLAGSLLFLVFAVLCGLVGARAFRGQPGILSGSLEQLDEDYKRMGAGR